MNRREFIQKGIGGLATVAAGGFFLKETGCGERTSASIKEENVREFRLKAQKKSNFVEKVLSLLEENWLACSVTNLGGLRLVARCSQGNSRTLAGRGIYLHLSSDMRKSLMNAEKTERDVVGSPLFQKVRVKSFACVAYNQLDLVVFHPHEFDIRFLNRSVFNSVEEQFAYTLEE